MPESDSRKAGPLFRLAENFSSWLDALSRQDLAGMRQAILSVTLQAAVILGAAVLLPGSTLLYIEGNHFLIAFIWCAYAWTVFTWRAKGMTYNIRAFSTLFVLYVLGIVMMLSLGPLRAGFAYFFAFQVMAAVLLGNRGAVASLFMNVAALMMLGVLVYVGAMSITGPADHPLLRWANLSLNYLFMMSVCTVFLVVVTSGLERHGQRQQEILSKLAESNRDLSQTNQALSREIEQRAQVEKRLLDQSENLERLVEQRHKALAESERSFRLLVENAQDVIFTLDGTGAFTWINEYALGISGYKREEFIGRVFTDLTHPEDLPVIQAAFRKEFHEKTGKIRDLVYRAVAKDGSPLHLHLNASLFYDKEGRLYRMHGVARDITELKRLETRLLQAEKMQAIGTLAGGIAHDFNNLLMTISGRASLLTLALPREQPFTEHLRAVTDAVKSASDLTNQLLGLAKGGRYEPRPLDMNELLSRTARMFGRTRKEVVIKMRMAEGLCRVEADRSQMEQVFLNILVNAWQAMPGGGEIAIATEQVALSGVAAQALLLSEGRYVKVSVADTGVGMDAETRKRIFDPFYTTKAMGRGTGLGLASAWGIVKNHGGAVTVMSEKGKGSLFVVYLPATDKEPLEEESLPDKVHSGRGIILLVEDEPEVAAVEKELLETLGYHVLVARSGDEAVGIYKRRWADIVCIVLDMIMPGKSGAKTFEELCALNPGVKVLLSSGYSMEDQAREICKSGRARFIQKPFDLFQLSEKLEQTLAK
ncbi:MAG: PAS domain S-box protein [Thermodesulfobacteriota bacterium]